MLVQIIFHGIAENENDFQGRMILLCSLLTFSVIFIFQGKGIFHEFCTQNRIKPREANCFLQSFTKGRKKFHRRKCFATPNNRKRNLGEGSLRFRFSPWNWNHCENKWHRKLLHTNMSQGEIVLLNFGRKQIQTQKMDNYFWQFHK